MNNPIYQIGEEVILQSPRYPQYNGEYTITEIISGMEMFKKYGVLTNLNFSDIFYQLGGLSVELIRSISNASTGLKCDHVHQNSLRKKHKPSEDSFDTMISKLKIGETV